MTISLPTLARGWPSTQRWTKQSNTQTFTSPLTQSAQTQRMPGSRWMTSVSWDNLTKADVNRFEAWLAALQGAAGRFYMPNFRRPWPEGTAGGSPLVNGANQSGYTLATDGWTPFSTLLAGDYIGFNGGQELRVVVANTAANASGQMVITLDEPPRTAPADNGVIVTRLPTCIMRLTEDAYSIEANPGGFSTIAFDAVETWF